MNYKQKGEWGEKNQKSRHKNVYCTSHHLTSKPSQDTFFNQSVFESSQLFHHDVYKAGDEARQEADQAADHPAADLQTAKSLETRNEAKGKADVRNQRHNTRGETSMQTKPFFCIHHEAHPPLLLQKQLVFNVIIVETLKIEKTIENQIYPNESHDDVHISPCMASKSLHFKSQSSMFYWDFI